MFQKHVKLFDLPLAVITATPLEPGLGIHVLLPLQSGQAGTKRGTDTST